MSKGVDSNDWSGEKTRSINSTAILFVLLDVLRGVFMSVVDMVKAVFR